MTDIAAWDNAAYLSFGINGGTGNQTDGDISKAVLCKRTIIPPSAGKILDLPLCVDIAYISDRPQSQMTLDPRNLVLRMMIDINNRGLRARTDFLDQGKNQLSVHVIQSKTGLIENQ